MRGSVPYALVLLLAASGCRGEPPFDERYQDQEAALANQANAMEAELNARLSAANEAMAAADADPGNNDANASAVIAGAATNAHQD